MLSTFCREHSLYTQNFTPTLTANTSNCGIKTRKSEHFLMFGLLRCGSRYWTLNSSSLRRKNKKISTARFPRRTSFFGSRYWTLNGSSLRRENKKISTAWFPRRTSFFGSRYWTWTSDIMISHASTCGARFFLLASSQKIDRCAGFSSLLLPQAAVGQSATDFARSVG